MLSLGTCNPVGPLPLRVAACVVLSLGMISCGLLETDPLPIQQEVMIHVESDPMQPVEHVTIDIEGKVVGQTNPEGVARFVVTGPPGEERMLRLVCPRGFLSPEVPLRIFLRTLVDPRKVAEYTAQCQPTERIVVVAVRAQRGPNLPVVYLGREVARTDSSGAAHVLLRVKPEEQFDLTLSTQEPQSQALRPQNPVTTFGVQRQDDLFLVDTSFVSMAVASPRAVRKAPVGPVRLE